MNAALVVLVATALLSTCMWARLLWQIWILRYSFKIAARAPVLVGVCGTSTLVVLSAVFLHWILLVDEGKGLPCIVMFWVSYLWIAGCMMPYCLRAIRLVVAFNTQYRLKYAQYVKTRNIAKTSLVGGTGLTIVALLVLHNMPERYSRDQYGCFFFNERRATEFTLILGVAPTIFSVFKLMKVHDVFGIGPEIVRVIVPIMIGGVTIATVLELLNAHVLEESRGIHFFMEMVIFVCFSNLLFWSVLVPVADFYGRCSSGSRYVFPVEDMTPQSGDDEEGVMDYAQEGGKTAEVFGDFCRKCLCMESWDFIMDSVAYKKLTNPHEQFASFIQIVDKYLRSRSPQGVNLGSKMQDQLLQFQTRARFGSLRHDVRRTILEAPVNEIVLMLEQNVLAKFRRTSAMRQRRQNRHLSLDLRAARDVAGGDKDVLETIASVSLARTFSTKNNFHA